MTEQCADPVEAVLKAALRLEHLGLSFRVIDRHIAEIMAGQVVVVYDRPHQLPCFTIVDPQMRVSCMNLWLGL